jgi:hypothetical protein
MRRTERIRKLRAAERLFEQASQCIWQAWEIVGSNHMERVLPGDDPATVLLREHVKKSAYTDLDSGPVYKARCAVRDVRRLMDGKP